MTQIRRPTRPALCALLLIAPINACTTWRTEPVVPAQLLHDKQPQSVRVMRADGSRVRIYFPRIAGDSLLGVGVTNEQYLGVALADIREIDTPKFAPVRTVGLALGIGVLVVGMLFVAVVIPSLSEGLSN